MTPQEKYYSQNRGPDLRRVDSSDGGKRKWTVNEMWDIHHEIARRLVLGQKNVRIAEDLSIAPETVSLVRNSPVVKEQIATLNGARDADTLDIAREIKEIAPEAIQLLKEIIRGEGDGSSASIALRARESNNMLARLGHGVPHKVQSENLHAFITTEDIKGIKERAIQNGQVIDV